MPGNKHQTNAKNHRYFAYHQMQILDAIEIKNKVHIADTLIFMHIPKTGGTNLYFLAETIAMVQNNFHSYRFSVPHTDKSPNLITEGWQGALPTAKQYLADNNAHQAQFISGHFPFGLHKQLSSSSYKYIAICRHPIERALSSVNFDYQRGDVSKEEAIDYLRHAGIDNPQTRLFAGEDYMSGPCNEKTLELAKNNIMTHFLCVGITEETNEFIQVIATIMGWTPFALSRAQVTGTKVIEQISPELRIQLKKKHAIDLKLYAWVKAHWLNWKKTHLNYRYKHSIAQDHQMICIPADYAQSRTHRFLSSSEVQNLNQNSDNQLLESDQQEHRFFTPLKNSQGAKPCSNKVPLSFNEEDYHTASLA